MNLERKSPCKINLLLNVLGKRADGFHELETFLHPVQIFDSLEIERIDRPGVELSTDHPELPADSTNLVHRAASAFFRATQIHAGARIHLRKRIPLAAGLGGGSSNAAQTLLGLNELFENPLSSERLHEIAASLGSDIPFFLQDKPALATGRGEKIIPLNFFPAFKGAYLLLVHPGFGVSTGWAYQKLSQYPAALNGEPGRAEKLAQLLQTAPLQESSSAFYNSLEVPVLPKYPILSLYQDFLRDHGAIVTRMSGSGSTTFALFSSENAVQSILDKFQERFGRNLWISIVPMAWN